MHSIPHSRQATAPQHPPTPVDTISGPDEAAGDQVRGFFYDARRALTAGDYLLRKWLPILGPDLFTLIKVLRSMCYFNRETGELRDQCWPTYETLAAKCGVTRATIGRWLKRDTSGQFVWSQKGDDGKHQMVWSPLNLFLQVQRRRRYCAKHQHRVQTSNLYLVALDDPLTPEDEEVLQQQETEWAAVQQRTPAYTAHSQDAPQVAVRGGVASQNETQSVGAKRAAERRRTMSLKVVPERDTLKKDLDRTRRERPLAKEEMQDAEEALPPQPESTQEVWQGMPSLANRLIRPAERDAGPRHSVQYDKRVKKNTLNARGQALAEAMQMAGGVIARLLQEGLGASNPAGGTQTILEALVEAGTPLERMVDLAALGVARLRQQLALGNPIENQAGYYIAIMRDLALEALMKRWDTAQMEQEDAVKFEQALRRTAHAGHEATTPEEEATESILKEETLSVDEGAEAGYAAPIPVVDLYLPDGVALLKEVELAALLDHVPDPQTSQPRTLRMLWGFVREALRPLLNLARRQHLDALTPKWDATRPRTLLLLSSTTYTARFVEQALRVELERQIEKLLAHYFDEFQIAYVPVSQDG